MRKLILIGLTGLLTGCATFEQSDLDYNYSRLVMKASRAYGNCDAKTMKLSEYLIERDIKHIVTAGYRTQDDSEIHAWVEVYTNGNKYVLDPAFRRIEKNPKDTYVENKRAKGVWEILRGVKQ